MQSVAAGNAMLAPSSSLLAMTRSHEMMSKEGEERHTEDTPCWRNGMCVPSGDYRVYHRYEIMLKKPEYERK
jgi:hypothetical protein